ncbi:MAG: hypothetical protein LBQ58_09820 [Synergistaceae bacterium]|jgi:hypothetical protein|nr:hypothetical protein [Synergistaceae bacterium]
MVRKIFVICALVFGIVISVYGVAFASDGMNGICGLKLGDSFDTANAKVKKFADIMSRFSGDGVLENINTILFLDEKYDSAKNLGQSDKLPSDKRPRIEPSAFTKPDPKNGLNTGIFSQSMRFVGSKEGASIVLMGMQFYKDKLIWINLQIGFPGEVFDDDYDESVVQNAFAKVSGYFIEKLGKANESDYDTSKAWKNGNVGVRVNIGYDDVLDISCSDLTKADFVYAP